MREEKARTDLWSPDQPAQPLVTTDEVVAAILRKERLLSEIAEGQGAHGAGAPLWAAGFIAQTNNSLAQTNNSLAGFIAQTNNSLAQTNNSLAQTNNSLNLLANIVVQADVRATQNHTLLVNQFADMQAKLSAMSANTVSRRVNQSAMASGMADAPFAVISKETAGVGDALIAQILAPGEVAPVPLAAIPAVGSRPQLIAHGGCFPDNLQAFHSLTDLQILCMIQYYNCDFGIVAGEALAQRKIKVQHFL
jgi:hypothetical protein